MGRNNKSLDYQMHARMQSMTRFGESRFQAKNEYRDYCEERGLDWNPARATGIFSHNTYKSYQQTSKEFCSWIKENHSGIKKIDEISKDIASEYLKSRQGEEKSAWTVSKDMSALNKILNLDLNKKELGLENRQLEKITRSRDDCDHDKSVDYNKYKNQIIVALGTGCRRQSILKITPRDFVRDGKGQVESVYLKEKGGRERYATILQASREVITEIVDACQNENMPISTEYSDKIDNHSFRSEYAMNRYDELLEEKGFSEDDYRSHDSESIQQVSEDLGHSRLSVVVDHYMR